MKRGPHICAANAPVERLCVSRAAPRKVRIAAVAALLALAACTQAAVPVSAIAGPGPKLISPYDAGVIFADTCLIRGPQFEDAVEGVRVHNVTRNTSTGTYYHNSANLSVKVTPSQCSMVFASKTTNKDTVANLAKGTASIAGKPPRGIDVTSQIASDGLRYFRVAIKSPVVPFEPPVGPKP